jgi:hypothetical protein
MMDKVSIVGFGLFMVYIIISPMFKSNNMLSNLK